MHQLKDIVVLNKMYLLSIFFKVFVYFGKYCYFLYLLSLKSCPQQQSTDIYLTL